MDFIFPRVAVPHGTDHVQRRVQLDGHVSTRQRHRHAVRTVGVLRPVGDASPTAGTELRFQQDQTGGVVRVELRRQKRTVAVRERAGQIHSGGRVRRVRSFQMSQVGQMFSNVGPGL